MRMVPDDVQETWELMDSGYYKSDTIEITDDEWDEIGRLYAATELRHNRIRAGANYERTFSQYLRELIELNRSDK